MKNIVFSLVLIHLSFLGRSQSTINLYSNYETIGINVILSNDDNEYDAYANVQYKKSSESIWLQGFPLSRMENDNNMLAGTIFWCEEGTSYDVIITIIDSTTNVLNNEILTASIFTRTSPSLPSPLQVLHTSPTGSGSKFSIINPGNLQEALNIATSGTKILLDSGKYFVGNLTLPNSGTASNPIQIIGSTLGEVILDGGHENPLTWTAYGGQGVFVTNTDQINPNLVIADQERLFPHQTYPDLKENIITLTRDLFGNPIIQEDINISGFYRNPTLLPLIGNYGDPSSITNNKLYIKFLDGSDPNTKDIKITKQDVAIHLVGNEHIHFKNINFKYYGLGHKATAVILENSKNIVFDNCAFEDNNTSIRLNKDTEYITISHCHFSDHHNNWNAWKMKSTQDYGVFVNRFPNGSRNLEKGAIMCGHNFIGKNIVIDNNTFEKYHQVGQLTPTPTTDLTIDTLKRTLEIDFSNNSIFNATGDGFEIEGIVRNIRVFKNQFNHIHSPISMAVAKEGPAYILRNTFSDIINDTTFYNNSLLQIKGHPIKFQFNDNSSPGNGSIFLFHNTIDAQNNSYGFNLYQVSITDAWKELVSKNNIFVTNDGFSLNVRTLSYPNFKSDYNGFFSENPTIAQINIDNNSTLSYSTIDQLFVDFGWDEHSIQADPQFDNNSSNPYELLSSSPMIDSGVTIQGINDLHISGSMPDIGAIEHGLSLGVSENERGKFNFLAYPNPFYTTISIENNSNIDNFVLELIDLNGRTVLEKKIYKFPQNIEFDLSSCSVGIYFILIKTNENIQVIKLIKSR